MADENKLIEKMEMNRIRNTINTVSDLIFRSLAFSEKFTTLCKVIANTSDIGKTVKNIKFKLSLIAIILLNLNSYPSTNQV
jgi:hypothetical protein